MTTAALDSIAVSAFSVLQYKVVEVSGSLGLSLSNSVTTLDSNYVFTFQSANLPIDGLLTFALSSMHTINGGCFAVENSSFLNSVLSCAVVNSTAIVVSLSGDIAAMMIETVEFTITLTNVTNPATVQPLTYSTQA